MLSLYFIKSIKFWGYSQYPQNDVDIIKPLFKKGKQYEQLFIHRIGDRLYLLYCLRVAKRKRIGIGLVTDKMPTDYQDLILMFRNMLSLMASEKLLVRQHRLRYKTVRGKLKNNRVNFDIFIRTQTKKIEGRKKIRWVNLPMAQLDVSKADVVRCNLENRDSEWISNLLRAGYHNIYITICNDRIQHEENINNAISAAITDKTFVWKMEVASGNPYKHTNPSLK